jgi:LCP family protein required for cell wall assembly
VTVLVVGTDSNDERAARGMAINTDAMLVASIDAQQKQISVVALPRDTVDLPLGNGTIYRGKANAIYGAFGIATLRRALSTTYGIPIDYQIEINMSDFGRLVTAVGGLKITATDTIADSHLGFYMLPGTHTFNANSANMYVRSRHTAGGDYGRGRRQMQVLVALVRRATVRGLGLDLAKLMRDLGSVHTDIPVSKLRTFIELARRSATAKVVTQVLEPPRFAIFQGLDGARGWVMIPNVPAMRAYVRALMPG